MKLSVVLLFKTVAKTMKGSSILPKNSQENSSVFCPSLKKGSNQKDVKKYLFLFFDKLKPKKILWRLRRKSHPSTNVSTNDSTALQFWLLHCIVIGWKNSGWSKFMSYFRTPIRRKVSIWSLPKKFIADNSRTSSFEFFVSLTIMVGNKTHLRFQNITKIKLNYRIFVHYFYLESGVFKPGPFKLFLLSGAPAFRMFNQ